jgi:hypothetical protein
MHDQENNKCDGAQTSATGGKADNGSPLTSEQLQRWAARIAEGQDPFPRDLPAAERERLATEVRRLRRERLLAFLARAIAQDIRRQERQDKEVADDQH